MDPLHAKQLLAEHYALDATLTALDGDRDANFLAETSDGQRYVFKVMHPDCSDQNVALQCAALEHLNTCELNLPSVIRSSAGRLQETTTIGSSVQTLWLLSWCPGTLLADHNPHDESILSSFGAALAHLHLGLAGFSHPHIPPGHRWELSHAAEVKPLLKHIQGDSKALADEVMLRYEQHVAPQLESLPHAFIHNDANDYNVLVNTSGTDAVVDGLFDFGDMSYQAVICDIAIALAYLILDKDEPLQVCGSFLRSYCALRPLTEAEVAVLFDLIRTRLVVSIAISSQRQLTDSDPYITISQLPAKQALAKLAHIPPAFAVCWFRHCCKHSAVPQLDAVSHYLSSTTASEVIRVDQYRHIVDLSIGSLLLGAEPGNAELAPLTRLIEEEMTQQQVKFGFGRYAEARGIYTAEAFGGAHYPTVERRTEHLGIDIFCAVGTKVYAPLAGEVELVCCNDSPLDYGPLVILRHQTDQGQSFYTLYGHLRGTSTAQLRPGQQIAQGEAFAEVGDADENGGWTPHLHLQVILDLLGLDRDFPGAVRPSEAFIWRQLCPNPALLFPTADIALFDAQPRPEDTLKRRQQYLSDTLSLAYDQPLHIVRGHGQFLYDSSARAYLDVFNNVAHVGHSHPQVVRAVQQQMALLNTNTRYLHDNILNYAQRLGELLPAPLQTCFFVNSASEANELALRLARRFTGRHDMLVMAAAYHGHTSSLVEMSPYKYNGAGGQGPSDWVHEVPLADDYRGLYKRSDGEAGAKYAGDVLTVLNKLNSDGKSVAGFIAETLPSVGGQIVLPPGYLQATYAHVRAHGGVCIADEVQVGFGRLGDCFWGFQDQGVVPDIVVLGKPIGNGFPLAAVITTAPIAEAFNNGMEFFSTFGGNPVACAAGLAVLDVLEREQLQANAQRQGELLLSGLESLKSKYPIIGDVRGKGLFVGMELVTDRQTLEPAPVQASYLVNRLRQRHILAGTDGPLHNVIKIRPSMVIEAADIQYLLGELDQILGEIKY